MQAAWRGDRLYDIDETKLAVVRWVDFYKKNRANLDGDIIHLRRADGRDWDGILHVNPSLETRGLAMLYNPLQQSITRQIDLPLYYTGLTKTAQISVGEAQGRSYVLDRDYTVTVEVSMPVQGNLMLTVRAPK